MHSLDEKTETVLGEIPVIARLQLGSEHLTLIPTDTRIIVVYRGKRGAGALATGQLFGGLSGAFEDLFKSGKESLARPRGFQSPKEILASSKDNFAIGLDEIVRVEVEETSHLVDLTILTRNEKLEFSARLRFDRVVELLGKIVGDKMFSRRLDTREQRPT
ncbi:hypothetical protein E6H19_09330 [Candidatus Bathyarchaeota archaeon]|nr:MAG: hypothetical protein E6H19_09330 [Candidatus Bathyarchaeota archaeon]